ncbi:MAG: hypothetical protein KatS3mg114_0998 [Planctomycetaceae bacterium]|nr:MAG: hypothetical protein KatS3mg114_0998 [Planctomycetaceae bacterium]
MNLKRADNTPTLSQRALSVIMWGALVVASVRWLIPPEAVSQGGHLFWDGVLLLLASVLTAGGMGGFRRTGLDVAVGLWVGGHLLSGCWVLLGGGERRTAACLLAGWSSLGAWGWLLRALRQAGCHVALRRVWLALALTTAWLAMWQYTFTLPQLAQEIAPWITRYRQAASATEREQSAWKLQTYGVPLTEPGLTLFEKRLRDSREPFGWFALANTLGGVLMASVWWCGRGIFALGEGFGHTSFVTSRTRWWTILWWIVGINLLWGVILTKSRTALIAGILTALCALGMRGCTWLRGLSARNVRIVLWGAGIVLVWAWAISHVWDREVWWEAPKSWQYRWQYWTAAARLIAEAPASGIGLGQFRTHYLRVKLPQASEEIADPHQAFLETWLQGGLLAVVGFVWLSGWLISQCVFAKPHTSSMINSSAPRSSSDATSLRRGLWLSGFTYLVVFVYDLAHGVWDDRYVIWGIIGLPVVWVLSLADSWPPGGERVSAALAACCLLIHGQASGGFGWPSLLLVWLTWVVLSEREGAPSHELPFQVRLSIAGICFLGGLLVLGGLWWPAERCQRWLRLGDETVASGNIEQAWRYYELGAGADAWDPQPWARLADLAVRRVFQHPPPALPTYPMAVDWSEVPRSHQWALWCAQQGLQRDPRNVQWWQRQAETWTKLIDQTPHHTWCAVAVHCWQQVVQDYPTYAAAWSALARLASRCGDTPLAHEAARRALAQDHINHRWGHEERWLPATERMALEHILASPALPSPTHP